MRQKQTLYCFSPPVMVATFITEIVLLIYTWYRYKASEVQRIVMWTLLFLATFQLAEYYVCGGMSLAASTWSRVGYVAITILPPLGIHLAHAIAGRKLGALVKLAYATGIAWMAVFAFSGGVFTGYECGGNYVIFQLVNPVGGLYFAYYYAWLLIAVALCRGFSKGASRRVRSALLAQIIGYALFIVPTTTVNVLYPETIAGIPSVMCGFAVLFAITMVVGIMPTQKRR